MKLVAWTDGGGVSTADTEAFIGAVILNEETGEVLCEHSQSIGNASVNEAEYSGVLFALYWAIEHGATHLKVKSDSQLIVNQVTGKWRVREGGRHLADYLSEIHQAREDLVSFEIEWIPREENTVADLLSWETR